MLFRSVSQSRYHLIIFGWTPSNWKYQSTSTRGNKQYTSTELQALWTYGNSTVGPATGGSAYYIASYALKSKNHEYIGPITGEHQVFRDKMTSSQSLGLSYFIENQDSLVAHKFLPRYYQKLLKERHDLEKDPNLWENQKMPKRFEKLKLLNPQLHEHYQSRIEAMDFTSQTAHEKLAILEISDSLALCRTGELRTQSSLDKKQKDKLKEHFRNEAELNSRITHDLLLPCGTCVYCLKIRSVHWAMRVQHELSKHHENCFLTLTYSDEHVPSLVDFKERTLFTKFIKRLRRKISPQLIKYIASHEYGSKTKRPHHHLIIFGWTPSNWKYQSTSARGNKQYTSTELQALWTYGNSTTGPATGGSAYYIASYALKSKNHEYIDPLTGEHQIFRDKMTSSQSLGLSYFIENQDSLVTHKFLPRYYQKLLKERHDLEKSPDLWENQKMIKRL